MSLKVVFLGTPDVACPFLRKITGAGYGVCAVITQPDRKQGRGMTLMCPAVKTEAGNLDIKVFQPADGKELKVILEELKPDLGVAVAYGKLLKKEVLSIPKHGFINAHFSLLPKYRGAAPVRRAIMNGEKETGITVFRIDEGLDTGPVLLREKLGIGGDENAVSLFARLVELGRKLIVEAVAKIDEGKAEYRPQEGEPSFAPKIGREDTYLDFSMSVRRVYDRIRAFCFAPAARAVFELNGKKTTMQILSAFPAPNPAGDGLAPGFLSGFEKGKGIFIKCQEGHLFVEKVKPEGGRELNAFDYFVNGRRLKAGDGIFTKE
ncbi:MAG: methionyl-tRNA formyltransferase [Elusimicrobia bacterium CG08_land_8_20_14_0_20_51_18]|nr:MAG: methionyl-tRNA formyltransferase [Elusimicrobia bacterium CG08_land_8_20_14_0_20_51_18]